MIELLLGAVNKANDSGYSLDGDLCQMGAQKRFLLHAGFNVGQRDCYPVLRTQGEFDKAIAWIYKSRVEGWWHYRKRLVEMGVCTDDEFREALNIECDRNR